MQRYFETEQVIKLLSRFRHGVELTIEGTELFPLIERFIYQYRSMLEKADEIKGIETGIIRVGTIFSVTCHWMPQLINGFKAEYLNVHFLFYQGGQFMQYFTKTDKGENIPVHLESVSPSGKYFVGWHTKSRSIIHLYRKLSQTGDAVYGESMNYTSCGDDVGTSFSGVVWHEEYGFVKICFNSWDSFESESVRFYFDRDLYERKRKELHGEEH